MNLFVLTTISLKKKTEEDLILEWKISNLVHKRETPFEEHMDFIEGWGWKTYDYSSEDNCYFTDLKTAKEYALRNCGDMNDGGSYNYACITEMPYNATYAMTNIQSIYVFKFDRDSDTYVEVDINADAETKYIVGHNGCKHLLKE